MSKSAPTSSRTLLPDLIAGLTTGVANTPDAMASAILAGANPVQGLYSLMIGTPLGAIFGSSAFMNISATSALAITAGMALTAYTGEQHAVALSTLALLAGLIMALAGLLRLGRLLRYVANSVVIGFLTGVSINVILSQFGDFTGYSSDFSNKVVEAVDTLLHPRQYNLPIVGIGLLTVAVILLVDRTRLRNFSMLVGMVVGSAAVLLLGLVAVPQVSDIATIPTSLPMPRLPDFSLMPALLLDALALAIIALVQGAGCSKSYANPDGAYPDSSRDFVGQGVANIGAGLLQGMPIGGSVSGTALNISSGARSRWANIFSGLVAVLAVLLFSRAVSLVAMPAMAALLIVAGVQSIKVERIHDVWQTGLESRTVMLVTLILTLTVPLQRAVFLGVLLSILIHFFITSSRETRVTRLSSLPGGAVREEPAPSHLPGEAVTVLNVFGNMSFAGAETLEAQLPTIADARRPVVILRVRSQEAIGSSFVSVLERYAQQLHGAGGKLMLAGVGKRIKGQLDRTETTQAVLGKENVFLALPTLGESTRAAQSAAEAWLRDLAASESLDAVGEDGTPGSVVPPPAISPL